MGHRGWAWTAADRIRRAELELRDVGTLVPGAAAIVVVASIGHATLRAPSLAWVSVVALAAAAVTTAHRVLHLALVAAAAHAGADAIIGTPAWLAASLLRGAALVAVVLVGGALGTVLRRLEETQRRSLDEDAVTGLLNVRAFYDALGELTPADRHHAVLLVDIAGMRNLNERYGHPTGTEAVRALGHVLRQVTTSKDLVARLGSDEIAVALVDADRAGAISTARQVDRLLRQERITLPDGEVFQLHAYYGIAATDAVPGGDVIQLLQAADQAKLAAKRKGVDEIGVATDGSDEAFDIVPRDGRTAEAT